MATAVREGRPRPFFIHSPPGCRGEGAMPRYCREPTRPSGRAGKCTCQDFPRASSTARVSQLLGDAGKARRRGRPAWQHPGLWRGRYCPAGTHGGDSGSRGRAGGLTSGSAARTGAAAATLRGRVRCPGLRPSSHQAHGGVGARPSLTRRRQPEGGVGLIEGEPP